MPPLAEVRVSEEEREVLERWARRPKTGQALALRCRIVLAAAEGASSKEIAARLGCSTDTVGKWRGRFARRGLDGLHDEPRPGRPPQMSGYAVKKIDDMEAVYAGSFKRARAELGAEAFGLSVLDFPPTRTGIPSTITPRTARRRSTSRCAGRARSRSTASATGSSRT